MRAQANRSEDKKYLIALSEALDISEGRIKLDECGDWNLVSPNGIINTDSECWYLFCSPQVVRTWNLIKRKLSFMVVSQDGDDEGILKLDRMPSEEEAKIIRKIIGGRRRAHLSKEDRALLKIRLRSSSPTPSSQSRIDLND